MKTIFVICAFGILGAVIIKISEELFPKFKPFLLCGAGIVSFVLFAKWVLPIFQIFQNLGENSGLSDLFSLLIKGLGLSFLISISSSFCRDLGEEKIAEKLELGGKAAVLSLSLPILQFILNFIGELTN